MEFLLGYLAFSGGCYAFSGVFALGALKKLKNQGYKEIKKKKSFIENFGYFLKNLLWFMIPVVNIAIASSLLKVLTDEKTFEDNKRKLLEQGVIEKSDELLAKEEADILAKLEQENTRKSLDTMNIDIANKYSMMSDEEKLAFLKKERDMILNQKELNNGQYQNVKVDKVEYRN